MAMQQSLNVDTLRRAIEMSDADMLVDLYADDATMRVVDSGHPPSKPLELKGKAAIGKFYRDIFSRKMTHRIETGFAGDGHIAFTEECQYPDGSKVLCSAMADVADGHITRQINVQAWDE